MNIFKYVKVYKELNLIKKRRNETYHRIPFRVKCMILLALIKLKQCKVSIGVNLSLVTTIIAGILSVAIPLYIKNDIITFLALIIPIICLLPLVMSYISLNQLPSDMFAKVALTGQSQSRAIMFISKKIRDVCIDAMTKTMELNSIFEVLEKLVKDLLDNPKDYYKYYLIFRDKEEEVFFRITYLTRLAEKLTYKRSDLLDKIRQLILILSDRLHMSSRRICDHFFQYSPLADEKRFNEYMINCWNISEYINTIQEKGDKIKADDPLFILLHNLLKKNLWIYKKGVSRIFIQDDMINYNGLHNAVCSMAASPSSTTSVSKYAECLSSLAWDRKESKNKRKAMSEFYHKTRFLYRKQRAYPGMDLNYLCKNIYESAMGDSAHQKLATFLKNGLRDKPEEDLVDEIYKLRTIVTKYLYQSNEDLQKKFHEYINSIKSSITKDTVFLTQGFSRTVKICFQYLLSHRHGRVFVLRSNEMPSSIRSQMLYNELQEFVRERRKKNFATGSIEICDHLLLPEILPIHANVFIISGAEIFDKNFNIINCAQNEMTQFIRKLQPKQIQPKCIVVAGEHKKSKDLLYINHTFTRDHLEDMDSFTSHVTCIVTNKDIYEKPSGHPVCSL